MMKNDKLSKININYTSSQEKSKKKPPEFPVKENQNIKNVLDIETLNNHFMMKESNMD